MIAGFNEHVNFFLIPIHCVAHRTNLVALDAIKTQGYEELSKNLNNIINIIAKCSKISLKCRNIL